ncbi:MAG: gamma-glutamylcyclotransferase [Pseudanabaena sp. M158S2SP1A06QC]|nr:gamma-glutamylcyclotransferase [Pseudanabaena sp. M158S2SP1A06QC]
MVDMLKSLKTQELSNTESSNGEYVHSSEPMFYYFAYGSCMCPVDLKRSLGESAHQYVVGVARLNGYKLGFYYRSPHRGCGCLDIVKDPSSYVEGVLYCLPLRLSDHLDIREDVSKGGYQHELISVIVNQKVYTNVRTYSVVNKLARELAPNDWYSNVVLRGASTCGLTENYFWQLFYHIYKLQSYSYNYHNYQECG